METMTVQNVSLLRDANMSELIYCHNIEMETHVTLINNCDGHFLP